ncbi:MAG: methyl-accepting chemotaxis protein [Desulfatirhabdiaceae bacterium]
MRLLQNAKLRTRLVVVFLSVGIIPFVVIGFLAKMVSTNGLESQAYRQLITVREIKKKEVEQVFKRAFTEMEVFARSRDVIDLLNQLVTYHWTTDTKVDEPMDVTRTEYQQIYAQFGKNMIHFYKDRGYPDIYLICAAHGHVMFTCAKERDLGANLTYGDLKNSSLAGLWKKVVQTKKMAIVDFQPYAPLGGLPAAFVGYPIQGDSDEIQAVIVFQLSIGHINAIMNQRDGLGKTGEAYLVGSDRLMRSDSFRNPARFSLKASFANPDAGKVDTEAVREALAGRVGEKIITDYEGRRVLSAFSPLKIEDLNWAIISEIDQSEAFETLNAMNWLMGIVAVAGIAIITFAAFLIARSITYPIHKTAKFAERISEGDFTETLKMSQGGEIGVLSNSINQMVNNLRGMIGHIVDGVETLFASSTELSAISRQMSSNASQTSDRSRNVAVAAEQMSANMSSVAAAAEQASTSVNMVAAASEEMTSTITEIARNAEKARTITNHAVSNAQKASDTVNELGKAAKEIGKVTETIADISDQTNLLALNATIEAARAGDAGRGFAVVANEIKELAKQTAEATDEIKLRIEGIQDTTSGTVAQIQKISAVINDINEIVTSIASAVEEQSITTNDIACNVSQAAIGIQEVTQNVSQSSVVAQNIARDIAGVNQSGQEISANSAQVNVSAEELKALAKNLQQMVDVFKV